MIKRYFTGAYIIVIYTCIRRKRHLSFRSSKDLERISPADSSVGDVTAAVKQILISYVRAEAAQHALRLKQELSALGFSVYLVGLSVLLWFLVYLIYFVYYC